jgi:hypothetical protein
MIQTRMLVAVLNPPDGGQLPDSVAGIAVIETPAAASGGFGQGARP